MRALMTAIITSRVAWLAHQKTWAIVEEGFNSAIKRIIVLKRTPIFRIFTSYILNLWPLKCASRFLVICTLLLVWGLRLHLSPTPTFDFSNLPMNSARDHHTQARDKCTWFWTEDYTVTVLTAFYAYCYLYPSRRSSLYLRTALWSPKW